MTMNVEKLSSKPGVCNLFWLRVKINQIVYIKKPFGVSDSFILKHSFLVNNAINFCVLKKSVTQYCNV